MYTKRAIIFLFTLIASNVTLAQSDTIKNKAYIGINGGFGISFGLFPAYNNQFENFAKTGYTLNVNSEVLLFHSFFGISIQGGYAVNDFDSISYTYTIPRGDISGGGPYYSFHETSNSYKQIYLLAGPCIVIPVRKFYFDLRIMAGISSFNGPGVWYGCFEPGLGASSNDTLNENSINVIA